MKPFRHLSRRAFLRGAGAALGLPLLNAMTPRAALAGSGAATAPVRLAWVFYPNGTNAERWQPQIEGADWDLTPSLEPLAAVRQHVTVFSGLSHVNARSLGDGPGDHARSAATFLTGAHAVKTSGADIRAGKSIDQVAAELCGRETRLPSIELGTERGRSAGSCDSGYACAYSGNISWRTPSLPTAKEINPRLAFERLFGNGGAGQEDAARRMFFRKSILDMVADDAATLKRALGQTDRHKLDEYFASVRDVELRIERMMTSPPPELLEGVAPPPDEPADVREHIRLMYDLMVLAFRTDTTRVATFMLANEGSNKTYPMIGVNDGHHQLSHHKNDPDKIDKIASIDRFFVEQFTYFVEQLASTPDGDGALIDHTLVVYGGAIRDGNRHDHHNLPILLAGHGNGLAAAGRHLRYEDETPLTNLYLSMLGAAGASLPRFGDSTGPLAGLAS